MIFTRKQFLELVEVDEGFLASLEREEIVISDTPGSEEFSERMLERARVARNLVRDLDVNLAGVAIILHMREEMAELQRRIEEVAREFRRRESR